jgi:peptidyl-prolyl cis-trans isomerase SurA
MHRRLCAARSLRALLFATVVGASSSVAFAAQADGEVIERVVAVVNDQAVFLSDLRRRAAPFLEQAMSAPSQSQRASLLERLYAQMLDQLVDEELIRQAAQRMDIRVSNADLEHAITNVQEQNELSDEEFWQAVRAQGYSEAQYRSDLRRQLLRLKVINTRVRGRVNITEEDVRREYEQAVRRENRRLRFRASHLFLPLPAQPSATDVAAVRDEADTIRDALTAETFADAVASHGGGELGWLSQGDLPEELENALMTLAPNEISEPVRGPSGFHIFLLHERETAASGAPSYEDVKDEIYRHMLDEAMTRQEGLFLEELRRGAVITRHE